MSVTGWKGAVTEVVDAEGIRPATTVDAPARLRQAFAPDGNITAGSASPVSDGAVAVVVTSLAFAPERCLTPLARIGASGQVAGPDATLNSQPSRAIRAAMGRGGLAGVGRPPGPARGPRPAPAQGVGTRVAALCGGGGGGGQGEALLLHAPG